MLGKTDCLLFQSLETAARTAPFKDADYACAPSILGMSILDQRMSILDLAETAQRDHMDDAAAQGQAVFYGFAFLPSASFSTTLRDSVWRCARCPSSVTDNGGVFS